MRRVAVVGAGPAGLLAAATAAQHGAQVTLFERNEKPGMKLRITGKGRCNVTNATNALDELIAAVPVNGRFLFGAFSRFMPADTMELFERLGVPLKVERGGRVFPRSDNAHDIADALVRHAKSSGVRFVRKRVTSLGECRADAVIVATGGASYPATGSTGDGYALAEQAGHTIVPPKPSLVPLECHEGFCARLMGLSLRNTALELWDSELSRVIYRDFGELLFTHFGVSGPMALSASSHMRGMRPERYRLRLDLKPALSPEQLDKRVLRDFAQIPGRNFINALNELLPKSLVPVVAQLSGIPPGVRVNQVTREQRQALVALLGRFELTVTGFRPIEEAIVTSGGVCTGEVHPNTMESKLLPGLYFAGEVLDADAYTGGFNLQIAFSTGTLAGASAALHEK
ncbi:MAG: NAD(P)/FAD-dependent oxidoreductase [Oscillospiraceae bacterium]|nr:NAD(P)/FAD-dependent oxidoreductase [Oscillospiraceae bacterium]